MFIQAQFFGCTVRQCLLRGGVIASACLLTACINPPVTNNVAPAPVTNAPNVPVVHANVPNQSMPSAPAAALVAPAAATVASAVPMASGAQNLLLQAGTFSMRSNADSVANTIRNKLPQFANLIQVRERGSNWRVLIGNFANEAIRNQAAQAIRTTTGFDVVNAAP